MNDFNFLKDHRSVLVILVLTNEGIDQNKIDFEQLNKPILYKTQNKTYDSFIEQIRSSCFF